MMQQRAGDSKYSLSGYDSAGELSRSDAGGGVTAFRQWGKISYLYRSLRARRISVGAIT